MYDWVTVAYTIDPAHQNLRFRTASLPGPALRDVTITGDGALLIDGAPSFYCGDVEAHVTDAQALAVDYSFRFHEGRVTSVQNIVTEIRASSPSQNGLTHVNL